MKYVMNAIQTLALQIHTIGSFTDALSNYKESTVTVAQVTAVLQREVVSR